MVFAITIGTSLTCLAESYSTYVDVFGSNTVGITIGYERGAPKIKKDEVTLNGADVKKVSTATFESDVGVTVESEQKVILNIPSSVEKTAWNHQEPGRFSNGDSRVLRGSLIINDQPVSVLVEIYGGE